MSVPVLIAPCGASANDQVLKDVKTLRGSVDREALIRAAHEAKIDDDRIAKRLTMAPLSSHSTR
jgi:hypothetical protein